MDLGVDSILWAIIFLLPGFLTSTLVNARTPAKPPRLSAFQETAQSLLRSAYIHVILAATLAPGFVLLLIVTAQSLPPHLDADSILTLVSSYPLPSSAVALIWLGAAFLLAAIFGYWIDPLDWLVNRLHKGSAKVSEDTFHLLTEEVRTRRKSGAAGAQLWVQATTTENHIFQGQFFYASYAEVDQPREFLLAKVFHYSPPDPQQQRSKSGPHDFVFLPMDSCHALEFAIFEPPDRPGAT